MRYRKRSKRSYRRDCRKRYNKKTRQCKTRSKSKSNTRFRRRNSRRNTMRGGYTLPKGINIPNKYPYIISQTPYAEFSRAIYNPRLPKVTPIPVRQSKDFFGQTGPVSSEHNVLYTKLNPMKGGSTVSPWFADGRFSENRDKINETVNNRSQNPEVIKKNKVHIFT